LTGGASSRGNGATFVLSGVSRGFAFCGLTLESEQGIVQRGMDVENRQQVGELEQVFNPRIGASQLEGASTGPDPQMHHHQLAETGAVNNLQPTEFDYHVTRLGQELCYFFGEGGGLVAIGKAAFAVENGDVIDYTRFQI
jgi:hypothetical protein